MSRRALGGGRVLGSGRSLSPAVPPPQRPNANLLSPSESSISLNSQTSVSPLPSDTQDLTSRISLENGEGPGSTAAAAASARLMCPICNEEMVTLLQLNRHLDDVHKNLEDERQDEVKDWFKTQMVKAKKFQPLAVLNQKLKGLDVFESNDDQSLAIRPVSVQATPSAEPPPRQPDSDEVITREHWQRHGYNDACSEPMCGKRLNATNGSVNCRKCGKLFCEEHTMYQMKLSRSAQHEPVRGIWCRVCETCYKSREGYNDRAGLERDDTQSFKRLRQQRVDKAYLEVSRLEKRLTKLTQLLANSTAEHGESNTNPRWSLSRGKDQRKLLEQTVVSWQEDASVPRCPYCQQEFTSYTFRRHHCRTCGKVVCGDPQTECSTEIGLNVATKKPVGEISVDVRLCKECKATLFDKRDFREELGKKPPDTRSYENLNQFERGIRLLLPQFQRLLVSLQDPDQPPTADQLANASKTRKRLLESFTKYDQAARHIRDLPSPSPTQQKLQKAIYQQASNFLHLHMLPLKTLPNILKHATPHGRTPNGHLSPALPSTPNGRPTSALTSIRFNDTIETSSQVTTTSNSSAVSALEAEEKSLRERLIVLEEQKFLVSEMIADANKRRKFDEVASLAVNVEDLGKEIDAVNGMLGQLDFAGVYGGNGAIGTAGEKK